MLRRFPGWLNRPPGRPAPGRRRRRSGCLLWLLILIGLLVILSLFFGSYQKGIKVTGMAPPFSAHIGTYRLVPG